MNLAGETLQNKYKILELLGEGGTSFVYKAQDLSGNQQVAIKWMKSETTSGHLDDRIRFKREIEAVSLLSHSGIVKIIESGEWHNLPFLVMEFLEGDSLAGLFEANRSFETGEAVSFIRQLSDVLDYVHGKGVIHRDLKPGNIFIISGQGKTQLKVLDFGLSALAELKMAQSENEIVGTFGYMSPEATGILKRPMDGRSDLYSLGVIFYQLLTEELPFKSRQVSRLIHEQIACNPLNLQKHNPGIPEILDRIVMKLLAKDPDLRYQSAKGLLYDLDRFIQGERDFPLGIKDVKLKLTYQPRLVGRDSEIARLKELYRQVNAGSGCVCLIGGEPGIGKSRLVEAFREYIYEQSGLFLMGRCINHENKTPYQPFKDILDEYIQRIEAGKAVSDEKKRLKTLLGDLGEVTLRINPRLEKLIGKGKALVPLEPERETQRFLMVLTKLFCQLSTKGKPAVIFLDDLQWADEGSIALLHQIVMDIGDTSTMVIGTYRDNETVRHSWIHQLKTAASIRHVRLAEMKLAKLKPDAIQQLIVAILGQEAEGQNDLITFILQKSHGNPLFAINILRELVENKAIFWNAGRWEIKWGDIIQLPIANSIVDLVIQRVQSLDERQTDLLCKAAIIGRAFDLELLYNLTRLPEEQVVVFVDQFVDMLLLEKSSERGRLLFAHDRIRDAFYQKLTDPERAAVHFKIAQTIEAANAGDYDKVLFELAHHYMEGNAPQKALTYVLTAADKAKASYANEVAITYCRTGLRLLSRLNLEKTEKWIRVNKNLAEIYVTVGKNHEAIRICEDILELISDPVEQALIYRKIGIAHFKIGTWEESEKNLIRALALLGEKLPCHKKLHLFFEIGKFFWLRFMNRLSSGKCLTGCFIPDDRSRIRQEIVQTYYTLNWMYILTNINLLMYSLLRMVNISQAYLRGSKEMGLSFSYCSVTCMSPPWLKSALSFQQQALAIRKFWNDNWGIAQSSQFFGWIYCWSGQHQKGIESFQQSTTEFQRIGDMWEYEITLQGLVVEYYYIAEYHTSLNYAGRYLDESARINNYYGHNMATLLTGICYLEMGDYSNAREFLNQALIESEERRMWFNHCIAMGYDGIIKIELGYYDAAIDILEKCRKLYESNSFIKDHVIAVYPFLAFAHLQKYRKQYQNGEVPVSKQDLNRIHGLCRLAFKRTRKWPNHFGFALRVIAEYYTLSGNGCQAERYYLKSIEHTRKVGRRFELGKCYYEYGNYLRTQNRPAAAYENLFKAYEIFAAIESMDYLERCRAYFKNVPNCEVSNSGNVRDQLTASRRLETVLATSRYISSILEIDELLVKVLEHAMELVGANRGVLLFYPESGEKRLEPKVVRNVTPDEAEQQMFVSRSILSQLENEKKPLIITDALADHSLKMQSSVVIHQIRSVICAPILNHGTLLGVLYLDNNLVGGLFGEDDVKVLDIITSQAGVSIENARLYDQLKAYSKEIEISRSEITRWNQSLEQRVCARTEELNSKNNELNQMIDRLKEYARTVEELATVKERNRLAMDVHDTLGNTMTLLIKLLEASKINIHSSPETVETRINDAITVARDGFAELKRSIKGLAPRRLETETFEAALQEFVREYQSTGVKIDFQIEPIINFGDKLFSISVFKVCQEAVTNAVRHGKAKNVIIRAGTEGNRLILSVSDDGEGCAGMLKGSGLTGMEQRISALNGKITFHTTAGKGFEIKAEIPIEAGE